MELSTHHIGEFLREPKDEVSKPLSVIFENDWKKGNITPIIVSCRILSKTIRDSKQFISTTCFFIHYASHSAKEEIYL